jgi:hypothetical protein
MSSTIPLPPREQLYNRYCSNKHTHTCEGKSKVSSTQGSAPRHRIDPATPAAYSHHRPCALRGGRGGEGGGEREETKRREKREERREEDREEEEKRRERNAWGGLKEGGGKKREEREGEWK